MIDFKNVDNDANTYREYIYYDYITVYCILVYDEEDIYKYELYIDICNQQTDRVMFLGEWNEKEIFRAIEQAIIKNKKTLKKLFDCVFKG